MASAQFTSFDFKWKKTVSKLDRKLSIRRCPHGWFVNDGPDTLFHFTPERVQRLHAEVKAAAESRALKKSRKKHRKNPPPALASMIINTDGYELEDEEEAESLGRGRRKRGVSYADIDG